MKNFIWIAMLIWIAGCTESGQLSKADQFFKEGQYNEAIDLYTKHLELDPNNVIALYNRGRSYEESGMPDKAIADFEKVLKIDKGHVQANLSMAMDLYFRQNDFSGCVIYLNNAIDRDKNNAKAYTLRGKAYQRLGSAEKAEKDFNTAINVNPEYADAYYAKANLMYMMNKKGEACILFRKSLTLGLEQAKAAIEKYCD